MVLPGLCDSASVTHASEDQNCAALTDFNLQTLPGGPAIITSAQFVDVAAGGLERFSQSGYAGGAARGAAIHRYCDVTGYVAPQNKFELRLPIGADWNHKFFFYACGGFCGAIVRDASNFGLERGYASATGKAATTARWDSTGFGPRMHRNCRRISAGAAIMLSRLSPKPSRRTITGCRSDIPIWPAIQRAARRFSWKHNAFRKTSMD